MKRFKQFLKEAVNIHPTNTLYAVLSSGKVLTHENAKNTEHRDAFPNLNFLGRGGDTTGEKETPLAWGRIDTRDNNLHIVTEHGLNPPMGSSSGILNRDINNRLQAIEHLETHFPNHEIVAGGGGYGGYSKILHSYDKHREHLYSLMS